MKQLVTAIMRGLRFVNWQEQTPLEDHVWQVIQHSHNVQEYLKQQQHYAALQNSRSYRLGRLTPQQMVILERYTGGRYLSDQELIGLLNRLGF